MSSTQATDRDRYGSGPWVAAVRRLQHIVDAIAGAMEAA